MSDAQWALQRAVFDALRTDTDLQAHLGDPARIHDLAPEEPIFPFLTLGQARARPHPRGPGDLIEHQITVHVWSKWGGRREVKEIGDRVRAALHNRSLDLSAEDVRLVNLVFVFSDVFGRREGDVHQALLRFRAVSEPVGALL